MLKDVKYEVISSFGKGIIFGVGMLITGFTYAVINVNIADKTDGDGLGASEINQVLGALEGVVNESGNVGIGMSPSQGVKLHVAGNVGVSGSVLAPNLGGNQNISICGNGYLMNGFDNNGQVSCVAIPQ